MLIRVGVFIAISCLFYNAGLTIESNGDYAYDYGENDEGTRFELSLRLDLYLILKIWIFQNKYWYIQ